MTIDEQIAILQAAKEGKAIEHFYRGKWESWAYKVFAFDRYDYRVKQEPREWWLVGCYVFGDRTEAEKHRFNAFNKSGEILLVREVIK